MLLDCFEWKDGIGKIRVEKASAVWANIIKWCWERNLRKWKSISLFSPAICSRWFFNLRNRKMMLGPCSSPAKGIKTELSQLIGVKVGLKDKRTLKIRREKLRIVQLLKTVGEGTGPTKKTRDTIGFWRSIISTSSARRWGDLIKSLKLWLHSSAPEKLSSAEATTKRWRRNIALSHKFYYSFEGLTTQQKKLTPSTKTSN